jgi:hypothetical protein
MVVLQSNVIAGSWLEKRINLTEIAIYSATMPPNRGCGEVEVFFVRLHGGLVSSKKPKR